MSRNYDNWERLVKAVLKRDQIWQLCHQDSISICSESSSYLEFSFPVFLGSFGIAADFFEFETSNLATLSQHVQEYFGRGPKAVIKLLDVVNVTEREFEEQMTSLRSCWHENVGIPWAYYFSEATKLFVHDYYTQGSVYDMLHGNGSTRPSWEIRARIALGAARGIAHVHAQCGGKLVHGNIKSSNIFLNQQQYGCVSDFGFKSGRRLQKKDVYSFGLLLLELVTSKPQAPDIVDRLLLFEPYKWDPYCFQEQGLYVDELDLFEKPIKEFPFVDSELKVDDPSVHQELRKTLRVAKRCLADLPQDRPTMSEVVSMLHDDTPELMSATKKRVWPRFLPFNR